MEQEVAGAAPVSHPKRAGEESNDSMADTQEIPLPKAPEPGGEPVAEPKTVSTPLELSKPVAQLLDSYTGWLTRPKPSRTPIHVDEIASKVAKIYELIRKVVDWKEDNVLRRSATERILKRLLFGKLSGISRSSKSSPSYIAETVTTELIRGGHLPNDTIPQEVLPILSKNIEKYLAFLSVTNLPATNNVVTARHNYTTFIVELAACEIEDLLAQPRLEYDLLDAMTRAMLERITVTPEGSLTKDEIYIQTYISVARTLFDLDDAFIIYRLLTFQYSDFSNPSPETLRQLQADMPSIWDQSEMLLNTVAGKQFYAISEQTDTVFALLGDVLRKYSDKPEKIMPIFTSREDLQKEIEVAYDVRYKSLKKRLFILGFFSTLSVFASNWFTFFLIEVPAAHIFGEGFNAFTTFIDFIVPTVVMFILVSIIKAPGPANKQNVTTAIFDFVKKTESFSMYEIKLNRPRRPILHSVMALIYMAIMFTVLGCIGWVFYIAGLPITSVIFDTATIAMTIFAAVTIRNKSKELTVGDKMSGIEFILDMISVPVAKFGNLLAKTWKQYNVVAFLFNFLVETPFALIIDVIEEWSKFIKERRSDIH